METPVANTEGSKFHAGRLELRKGDCGVPVFFTQTWRGATPPFMIGLKISLGLKRNTATHCAFEKFTRT